MIELLCGVFVVTVAAWAYTRGRNSGARVGYVIGVEDARMALDAFHRCSQPPFTVHHECACGYDAALDTLLERTA